MLRAFRSAFIPLLILLLALSPFGSPLGIGLSSHQGLPVIIETWQVLDEYYVEQGKLNPVRLTGGAATGMFHSLFDPGEGLTEGAIEGMLDTLNDPYSYYLTAEEWEQMQSYYQGGATVDWIILDDDIAYIRIDRFAEGTPAEFKTVLRDAIEQGAEGIILDLRGNPGGLVDSGVSVAGESLYEDDLIMYDIDGHGERTEWRAEQIGQAADLPVAVLVNGYTASSAEIVAGALQDYGVWLIGSTTYGKGSICVLAELSDGSALCVTCARWYTPLDYCVEGTGLSPNEPGGLEKAIEYIKDEIGEGSPGGLISEEVLLNV